MYFGLTFAFLQSSCVSRCEMLDFSDYAGFFCAQQNMPCKMDGPSVQI